MRPIPQFMMRARNISTNPSPPQPIQQIQSLRTSQRRQMTTIDFRKPVSCGCGK